MSRFETYTVLRILFGMLFILFISGMSGCKSDDTTQNGNNGNKGDVLLDLYIRYLEKEKIAKVTATFNERGDNNMLKPYEEPLKMWFQGRTLEPAGGSDNRRPGTYQIELDNIEPDEFEFVLEARKNKPETIQLDLHQKPKPVIQSFSITDGLQIDISSAPLQESQSLIIVVTDTQNTSASMTINGPFKGMAMLPAANFENLKQGDVTMYMVWKNRISTKIPGIFTEIDQEYYFSEIKTTLKE